MVASAKLHAGYQQDWKFQALRNTIKTQLGICKYTNDQ